MQSEHGFVIDVCRLIFSCIWDDCLFVLNDFQYLPTDLVGASCLATNTYMSIFSYTCPSLSDLCIMAVKQDRISLYAITVLCIRKSVWNHKILIITSDLYWIKVIAITYNPQIAILYHIIARLPKIFDCLSTLKCSMIYISLDCNNILLNNTALESKWCLKVVFHQDEANLKSDSYDLDSSYTNKPAYFTNTVQLAIICCLI